MVLLAVRMVADVRNRIPFFDSWILETPLQSFCSKRGNVEFVTFSRGSRSSGMRMNIRRFTKNFEKVTGEL